MTDVDITELDELQARKVSGVATAANGTPFLLLKAAACSTCNGTGTIKDGHVECPDCDSAAKSSSAEADEFEEEVLKEGAYCGNSNCGICKAMSLVNKELTAAERNEMPTKSFAFVDAKGGKHLPIHDKAHAKSALVRFKSTDFTGADKPVAAKQKAAAKIKSAAESHGIEVDPESDVATAAKKGAVQDALDGTQTPQEAGHLATGHSSTVGSITAGTVAPTDPAQTLGGATTTSIPDEAKVISKGLVVASLVEAMDALTEQRQAIKDGTSVSDALAASVPAIPLSELSSTLASCVRTLEEHLLHERVEAAVDPTEAGDVWDMEDAKSALECSLRLVANIAVMESLENEGTIKTLDVEKLIAVRQNLDDAIGVVKATQAGTTSSTEEEIHVADVTKSELADTIAASTVAAVEAAFAAKAAEQVKADEAAAKVAAEEAAKNANNGGDISEGEIKPTKEADADDVNAVKETPEAEVEGTLTKQVADQLEVLTKGLQSVEETVAKIAKRPRAGGPSLDGQARGVTPAAEGRQSDVTKSAGDVDIEEMQKSLEAETDPVRKSELGLKLTYARLTKLHETGQL